MTTFNPSSRTAPSHASNAHVNNTARFVVPRKTKSDCSTSLRRNNTRLCVERDTVDTHRVLKNTPADVYIHPSCHRIHKGRELEDDKTLRAGGVEEDGATIVTVRKVLIAEGWKIIQEDDEDSDTEEDDF